MNHSHHRQHSGAQANSGYANNGTHLAAINHNVTKFVTDQHNKLDQILVNQSSSLVSLIDQDENGGNEAGGSRTFMLQSLVARINTFMSTSFETLTKLCVSKQQESQLNDAERQCAETVQEMASEVRKMRLTGDSNENESVQI